MIQLQVNFLSSLYSESSLLCGKCNSEAQMIQGDKKEFFELISFTCLKYEGEEETCGYLDLF